MKYKWFFILQVVLTFGAARVQGQVVYLDSCELWAKQQYPLRAKFGLISEKEIMLVQQAKRLRQLQVQLAGQATYQSEVTELPISLPGISVPELSRDQYRLYTEFSQSLTAFGTVRLQSEWAQIQSLTERKQLELNQQQWLEHVRQTYFGLLLLEVQIQQLKLLQVDIEAALAQMVNKGEAGVALPRQQAVYEVEKLKVAQRLEKAQNQWALSWQLMSIFTGKELTATCTPIAPMVFLANSQNKPMEWELFDLQRRGLQSRKQMLDHEKRPKMNLFVQTGVGRPALNLLNNDFRGYYLGGLRLQWNLNQMRYLSRDQKQLGLAQKEIDIQQALFEQQNAMAIAQQEAKIERLQRGIKSDEQVFSLQRQIFESYAANVALGTITELEYVQQMHAVDQARQQLAMRQIQLLQAQMELKNLYGQY